MKLKLPLHKAFFQYHLTFTVIALIITTNFILFFWFPYPFFILDNTLFAIFVLCTVCLILGPLLTVLTVSDKKNKKNIIYDFLAIIFLQLATFIFGLFIIYQEKVVALVLADGVFHLVPQKEKKVAGLNIESIDLPKYKNIFYGELKNLNSEGNNQDENFFYNINNYSKINNDSKLMIIPKSRISSETLKRYNDSSFAIIIGKKRNGYLILDSQMMIFDAVLQ